MCPVCREKTVSPVLKDYAVTAQHDGASYEVTIHDEIPTCSRCGEAIITSEISERVSAELRRLAGLLPPERIRAKRESLGLTPGDLAATLRTVTASKRAIGSVFISHSHQDNELVRDLARRLRDAGLKPLVDFADVGSGTDWKKTVRERIRGADAPLRTYAAAPFDKVDDIIGELSERLTPVAND